MSTFPEDAACAGILDPLWDASVVGESDAARRARHARGEAICRRCPVKLECLQAVDPCLDDGIRGGVLLSELYGARRFGGYGAVQGIVRKPWGSNRKSA